MYARVLAMPARRRYAAALVALVLLGLAAAVFGSPHDAAQHLADGPDNGYWWGG